MTDDQHGEGTPQGGGRWNPLPQGDYDDGATAFVQLPEGGIDALLAGDSPLAAPGHGYVPPPITATHTDAAPAWPVPEGGQWPDPNAVPAPSHDDRFTYEPGATQQWTFEEPAAPAAPGHDVTGQWSIPVAGGDLPDESGEYTTSSLVEQWGGTPPATLPGGAPAPWAAPDTPRPWDTPLPDHTTSHPSGPAPDAYTSDPGYGPGTEYGHGTGYADPGHTDARRTEDGYPGAGYAEDGHEAGAYAEDGHGDGAYAEDGHGDGAYAEDGHLGAGSVGIEAGHAEDAYPEAGHAESGHGDAGHADALPDAGHAGHADDGHVSAGHVEAGHAEDGYPEAGHGHAGPDDAADGDTPAGTVTSAAPGEPVVPAHRPAGPDAAPETDAHGLAEASERPAEPLAGHEQPTDPAPASEPATAADTAAPEATADPAPAAPPETAPADTPDDAATAAERSAERSAEPSAPRPAAEPAADAAVVEQPAAHPAAAGDAADGATDDTPAADPGATGEPAVTDVPEAAAHPATAEPAAPVPSEDDGAAEDVLPADEDQEAREPAPDGAEEPSAAPLPPHDDHPLASFVLRVNGADRPVTDAWIGESLLYVLRERLGLAGAKDGCSQGECGACNVQVDGRLVASCLVPAVTTAGSEIRTVEGLAVDGQPSDVQRALARCGAVQCGFCVPGMAMTVHDLLEGNPAPTELEARQALCGNLCRCSGYRGVLEAVKEVVAEREAAHAGPGTDPDEARIPHQAAPGSGGVHHSAFEAPGAFAVPRSPEQYDTPDPYGTTPPGPQDQQHYGQDGGQA
ncbi:2Fe-2S iron-sulfur cluster-binding protein [Streptomyces sp. SCL15-4]|uniref:2Fe-2S iron-sulfur cluster-binding protein n=1 Tax=Streptomyces sp. SCL15-4 TaxID=2967221 RepID=UPI002966919D|nr:2Fe-2S iron-sulfur cluster-binding protein [Streptomyces sp. SCL15-4]